MAVAAACHFTYPKETPASLSPITSSPPAYLTACITVCITVRLLSPAVGAINTQAAAALVETAAVNTVGRVCALMIEPVRGMYLREEHTEEQLYLIVRTGEIAQKAAVLAAASFGGVVELTT